MFLMFIQVNFLTILVCPQHPFLFIYVVFYEQKNLLTVFRNKGLLLEIIQALATKNPNLAKKNLEQAVKSSGCYWNLAAIPDIAENMSCSGKSVLSDSENVRYTQGM